MSKTLKVISRYSAQQKSLKINLKFLLHVYTVQVNLCCYKCNVLSRYNEIIIHANILFSIEEKKEKEFNRVKRG